MNKSVSFIGIVGLIIFLFGLFTAYFVTHDPYHVTVVHLLIGGLLVLYFLIKLAVVFCFEGGASVMAKRVAGFGVSVTVYSALFVGILILVNYFVYRHDPLHYDSTEQKVYTLAPQTKKVLESLPSPVIIRAFYVGGVVDPEVEDLLKRIARASDHVSWKSVDPEKKPGLTEKYGISEKGTLHFSFDTEGSTREAKVVRNIDEQEVVNAILKLTRGGDKKVYWVSGHGESNLDEASEAGYLFLKEAIQGENIKVEKLVLGDVKEVPADASALLLMGPRRGLLVAEREAVKRYLANGGNAVILNEPHTTRDVAKLVEPLGIEVGDDIVLDQVVQLFTGPTVGAQPVITTYGTHPVISEFSEAIIFSTVSSVRKAGAIPEGAVVTEVALTSPNSWAEKKIDLVYGEEPQAQKEPEDIPGPVSVAAVFEGQAPYQVSQSTAAPEEGTRGAVEDKESIAESDDGQEEEEKKESRIVVIGDADFLANVNIRQLFNRDFFLNVLNWVVGEEEGVTIRARTLRGSTKGLTAEQFRSIFLITAVLLPELLLLWGFSVWWYRKS